MLSARVRCLFTSGTTLICVHLRESAAFLRHSLLRHSFVILSFGISHWPMGGAPVLRISVHPWLKNSPPAQTPPAPPIPRRCRKTDAPNPGPHTESTPTSRRPLLLHKRTSRSRK